MQSLSESCINGIGDGVARTTRERVIYAKATPEKKRVKIRPKQIAPTSNKFTNNDDNTGNNTETNNSTTRAVRPIPAGWPRGPRDPAVPCPVSVAYSGCHGHGVDTPGRRTHGHGQLDSAGRFNHDFRFSVSRYHSRGPAGPGTSLRLSGRLARSQP